MNKFDFKRFKEYINSYPEEEINLFSDKSTILDILYGIGISLNGDEYVFSDGFIKFLKYLESDILPQNQNVHPVDNGDNL